MRTTGTPAARALVAAALFVWLGLSLVPFPRPAPAAASAPATEFSSARAIEYVKVISQRPHPVRSEEHDRVRDYIQGEFSRLGLPPELQGGHAEFSRGDYHAAADVQNIVARLPGTANTKPILLVSHYDCAPKSLGASDDGHAVGVMLETLRALKAGPPLRNDVIFLVTDAEELGLFGAVVFMREHPWRQEAGLVLNFEARGTSGPSFMFETSENNAWMIEGLRAAVPRANATSMAYEIYRRMPNGTDLTVFKRGGLPGMNFAFIDHPEFYHTAQDNLANLDPVSVQEQGRYALSLTRWFGARDLSHAEPGNAIYFPTLLTPLIAYPEWLARPLALVTILVVLAGLAIGFRRHARGVWIGFVLLIFAAVQLWVIGLAAGVSYLLQWPVLGGAIAFALLVSARQQAVAGPRTILMALVAAPAFLLIVPLFGGMITALTFKGAMPVLIAASLLILVCVLPQLAFVSRRSRI